MSKEIQILFISHTSIADLYYIDTQTGERQFGRKAQLSNITAAKT